MESFVLQIVAQQLREGSGIFGFSHLEYHIFVPDMVEGFSDTQEYTHGLVYVESLGGVFHSGLGHRRSVAS